MGDDFFFRRVMRVTRRLKRRSVRVVRRNRAQNSNAH
jgi:hypothetical protein